MASNNYHLSPEVFVMIFKNLSFRDVVENCAKVCVEWESVVAQHFMQPFLVKVTTYDQKICRYLKNLGWSDKCSNPEKIVSSFNMEKVKNYPGRVLVMCGSGPYERDDKGEIDFDKEKRTRTVEVLDLLDPDFKKVIQTNFPLRDHCFGGILNNTPFFGGGFAQKCEQKYNDVFVLDKNKTKMKLKDGRYGAACAKMKGDVYWIFGGVNEEYTSLNTTEVVVYDSSENSWSVHQSATLDRDSNQVDPPINFRIDGHCVVNFDDQYMHLIGGVISSGEYSDESDLDEDEIPMFGTESRTWRIDMKDNFFEVKQFHSMRDQRRNCQAAVMNSRGRRVIVVAGGNHDHFGTLDSVEILDPRSGRWKSGPKLPLRLEHFAMISSPNETGVIIIGGEVGFSRFEERRNEGPKDPSHHLIELNGDTMEWKILDQKLERGRRNHIAIPIPYVYDLENLEVDRGDIED